MYRSRALWILLAVGLTLRLLYGLAQSPLAPYGATGGDDPWYLANALGLVTDAAPGSVINGIPVSPDKLGQPPVFFLVAGAAQTLLPPGPAVIALRILHALATTAVAFFGFGLAVRLVGGLPGGSERLARRAGLLAAAAIALSPALILESALIKTESLFLFFVVGGVWAYAEALARANPTPIPSPLRKEGGLDGTDRPPPPLFAVKRGPGGETGPWLWFLLAGVLLGLATLTRAVFLVFPLALVVFTLVALGWRPGWKHALALLAVYAAVVLSWTAYNLVRYQRLMLAGEGLASFVYLGATGWDSPQQVDERLNQAVGTPENGSHSASDMLQATGSSIGANLPGYLARRVRELGGALLQPHNVEVFGGESLRAIVTTWWTGQRPVSGPSALLRAEPLFRGEPVQDVVAGRWASARSLGGLVAITQADAFGPKLMLYVVHYTGLALGLMGVLLTRRAWRVGLPMLGYIGYVLLIHLILLALPRYVFPIMPFMWVFAASALSVLSRKD